MKRVISALSEGFEAILKQPWILLLPIALDLFLWLGPHISLKPLIDQGLAWMTNIAGQADPASQQSLQSAWSELGLGQVWQLLADRFNLLTVISVVNLISMLSLGILDFPSLVASEQLKGVLPSEGAATFQVSNGLVAAGLFLGLLLVGLVVNVLYQSIIAQQVRDERLDPRYLASHLGKYLVRVATLLAGVLGVLVMIGGPISFVFFLIGYLSPTLMQILVFMGGAVVLWFSFYLVFLTHGILLGEETPLRALWTSMNIVHKDFWTVIMMVILIRLIRTGFTYVWARFIGSTPGVAVAILGNAFLSTGLAAASFFFFRDSFVAWKEHLAQLAKMQLGSLGVKGENPDGK